MQENQEIYTHVHQVIETLPNQPVIGSPKWAKLPLCNLLKVNLVQFVGGGGCVVCN